MSEPKPLQQGVPPNVPANNVAQNDASPKGLDADAPVLFGSRQTEPEARNWALIAGFALVVIALALVAIFGRGKKEAATGADPYSPMLTVERAQLSQANNFVGSTITYIDVTVKNIGSRTVVGGTVQAVFRDGLGQVVQTETLPMRALLPHSLGGEAEAADLAMSPLGPGQERVLRLTVEHISGQWNQAQPELEFRALRFQ